jgi:NADH-quinone oxidoreductase subunit A
VLQHYLPAVIFLVIGIGLGLVFTMLNRLFGARHARRDHAPYESGMPSDGKIGVRFGISFYIVAILFLIFDVEVILLVPAALVITDFGWHALGAVGLFVFLLVVAFVYEWGRGSLDWK